MAGLNKIKVIGISTLFLVAGAFLVFGGPLGTLAFADTPVTAVAVSAVNETDRTTEVSTIVVKNGTIRMVATLTPAAPIDARIIWTVEDGTGTATIDRCGQLFAQTNGDVTVKGTSASNPDVFGTKIITISNQLIGQINIGTGANYTILAQTGISSLGVDIKGNIASNAATADSITGFGLSEVDSSSEFSTSAQVTGNVYLPTYHIPTPSDLTTATNDVVNAYNTGSLVVPPVDTEFNAGEIGGQLFAPGVHKWSTEVTMNSNVTLTGDANDVWIFQIALGLTQLEGTSIILVGGAKPENIFWLTATTVTIGVNCHFEGIILAHTGISVGAGSTIDGRLFAQTRVDLGVGVIIRYPGYIVH